MKNTHLSTVVFMVLITVISAQQIDIERFGKGSPFKLTGAINANTVFYNTNQATTRQDLTYFVQGGLNFSVYDFAFPIKFNYSNQGTQLNHQLPFNFNRLSIHPKYKWIQAHIGDANMTFSPYTLNAHQFTGGGIELTPKGGFSFAVMSGRLLRAVENDGNPNTIPSFRRMELK